MRVTALDLWRGLFLRCCSVLGVLSMLAVSTMAAEITLRMRGGGFELSGELKSYDLETYRLESPLYGPMSFKAERFECVAGPCPGGIVKPSVDKAPGLRAGVDLGTTTWIGSGAIGTTFMPALIESFASSNGARVEKAVRADPRNITFKLVDANDRRMGLIEVQRQGVGAGFDALATGRADVVWAGRAMTSEEEEALARRGINGLRQPGSEHVWGSDALVFLVAKDSAAVSLPLDTIADVFSGRVSDWGQVGLTPGPINIYAPEDDTGAWMHFQQTVLDPRSLNLRPEATRLPHASEWSDRVAQDPLGISVSSIAFTRDARMVNVEQGCGLVSRPDVFSVKTDEYPLTRSMYFYTRGQPPNPLAQALLQFAMSDAAQEALRASNFIDQGVTRLPFVQQGARIAYALNAEAENYDQALMREFIQTLRAGERLSVAFRFEPASVTLDAKSREQIDALRAALRSPELSERSALLVGFSDAVGAFPSNLDLSVRRAQAVKAALVEAGLDEAAQMETIGFGELAPVACNDTPEGRKLNRRVEVWVK